MQPPVAGMKARELVFEAVRMAGKCKADIRFWQHFHAPMGGIMGEKDFEGRFLHTLQRLPKVSSNFTEVGVLGNIVYAHKDHSRAELYAFIAEDSPSQGLLKGFQGGHIF